MGNRHQRNLKQDVTHWPVNGESWDGPDVGSPVVQKGRWEIRSELFRTSTGEETVSRAVVFLTSDVNVGDYLALGDHSGVSNPTTLADAYRVREFNKIPDLRNIDVERRAML